MTMVNLNLTNETQTPYSPEQCNVEWGSGAPTTVLLRGSGNTMTKISEAEQHYEPTTR